MFDLDPLSPGRGSNCWTFGFRLEAWEVGLYEIILIDCGCNIGMALEFSVQTARRIGSPFCVGDGSKNIRNFVTPTALQEF